MHNGKHQYTLIAFICLSIEWKLHHVFYKLNMPSGIYLVENWHGFFERQEALYPRWIAFNFPTCSSSHSWISFYLAREREREHQGNYKFRLTYIVYIYSTPNYPDMLVLALMLNVMYTHYLWKCHLRAKTNIEPQKSVSASTKRRMARTIPAMLHQQCECVLYNFFVFHLVSEAVNRIMIHCGT